MVPHRMLVLVPSQGHQLGSAIETAARHAAMVLECIHRALDECGGVGSPDQLHVAGPGPAQRHHEHPNVTLLPVLVKVGQAATVHLGLLPGSCLETHRGIRLPARRHVGLQDGIATVIAQGLELAVQDHAVFQPLGHPPVNVIGVSVLLSLSKGSILWKAGASAAWPPVTSGISAPYFERCPVPRRSPVWNGPLPSSRRSLSLVPPSAKSVEHLREDFVNDARAIGWVNSTPAISLILSSAITQRPAWCPIRRRGGSAPGPRPSGGSRPVRPCSIQHWGF